MRKKTLVILVLIVTTFFCCKKNVTISSSKNSEDIEALYSAANNDSLTYAKRNTIAKIIYLKIKESKNDSLKRSNYFRLANRYFNMNNMGEYKDITYKTIQLSLKAQDTVSLAKAYGYMADFFSNSSVFDSAYSYNYKAEKLYTSLHDDLKIAQTLLNKAVFQHNQSDFLGAERTTFLALKKLRYVDNDELSYQANNLLGIIYGELTEFKFSKKYYEEALKIANRNNISETYHPKAVTYNNIGVLYRNQKNEKLALENFKLGLSEKKLHTDSPNMYAMLLDNLAYSKFKLNELDINVMNMFLKSLEIRDSLNITPGQITSYIHLSEFFSKKNSQEKATDYAKKAYLLAKDSRQKRDILLTLKQLSNVEPKYGLKYFNEYYEINDSVQLEERKIKNKFARIEYQTEELTIEKDKLVEQRKSLIYIGLGILTIGLFIFVIRMQAAKNRELVLVQEQQKANEDVYQLMLTQQNRIEEVRQSEKKRIAQELHDGVLGKLFGTRMNLGVLNGKNDDKSVNDRSVFIDELKNLEQEIREISHDLSSEKAAIFNNFVLMVNNFIATQRTVCTAEIGISMDDRIDWNNVGNMVKINLYRILQEAFQNVNKHANAKNVAVKFFMHDGALHLEIKDDGIGFIYSKKKKGIGLLNMKARIADSAGTMEIETEPQKGTLLKFELPLSSQSQ